MMGAGLASFTKNWDALMKEVREAHAPPGPIPFPPRHSRRIRTVVINSHHDPSVKALLWRYVDERGAHYGALNFEHACRIMRQVDELYLGEASE